MTREEAKQIVANIDKAYRNFTFDEYTALEMAIKALEQEPKKGHWIEHIKRDEFDDYEEVFYECSECGIEDCYKFTYCPHCGAKMREVE